MTSRITPPVAMFVPTEDCYGRKYLPANKLAVQLAGVAGCRAIPEDRIPYIEAMGIETIQPNGRKLKEPKAETGPLPYPGRRVDVQV
jgi:hypothetical protein